MKLEGTVNDFNGYNGKIIDNLGKDYLLLKEEIIDNEKLNNLDNVTFVPEKYILKEKEENIARFVKRIKK